MIEKLLSSLRQDGVQIWSENGRVRYRAPKGVMTPERLDELRTRQLEIATFLQEASSAGEELPPIDAARSGDLPLSFAQERLWFLEQLGLAGASYHVAIAIRMDGDLDEEALRRTFDVIVGRHEVLRTRFETVAGHPRQIVDAEASCPFELIDLSTLTGEAQAAEVDRQSLAHATQPFDLQAALPLRIRLLRLAARRHVLLLAMHHIVSDAWSTEILIGEITVLYNAFCADEPSPLRPLPVQYADYALWQRRWLAGEALERQLHYWTERLAGTPPQLELPVSRSRSASAAFAAKTYAFSLSEKMTAELRVLARRETATLFMVLLAAFQLLLSRYSGQNDVVVGSPVAGRRRHELHDLIGFFANILVLRADCSESTRFVDLLAQVKDAVLDAHAHQDLPFERLVEALQPDRDLGRHPLVQVMFALQQEPFEELTLPGLRLTPMPAPSEQTKFDLTLHVYEKKYGLAVSIEYAAELFDAETIAHLAAHFQHLLEAIAADPHARLADLSLMRDAERLDLIFGMNRTARPFPRDAALDGLFAARVARCPQAIAIVDGSRSITYGELDRWSNGIAATLAERGVRAGASVGLSGDRSAGLIAGMLGIIKAGASYVPLDPGYPEERLAFMVKDAGATAVVAGRGGAAPAGLPVLHAEDVKPIESFAARSAGGEAIAYIMFTSGSTGVPKGIAVPHRAVSRLVLGTDYIELTADDRIAHLASPSFDAATFELWSALVNGAALVIIDRDTALASDQLAAAIHSHDVSCLFATTALFNRLAQDVPGIFARLRVALFGGEACDPHAVTRVLAHGAPERLLHVYGPTEATTFSTWMEVDHVVPGARTIPIGRPLANGSCHVLDGRLQPVPINVPGELHVGGDGLAHGYWGRPALTAEKFTPDPFGRPGSRLYATGDIVRRLPDGNIEYLSRRDGQVKIRGFRIELQEIESVLRRSRGVGQAAVLVREGTTGTQLAAYVVPVPEARLSAEQIRQHLKQSLPDFMVPTQLAILDRLPLTSNGKLDRARLPDPEDAPGHRHAAPATVTQQMLAVIWSDVLGVATPGIDDDFFSSGGHSLMASRLVGRLNAAFNVNLPLRTVFETPTIRLLAAAVEQAQRDEVEIAPPPLSVAARTSSIPLSYTQEPLWFLEQVGLVGTAYNMAGAVRLQGRVDIEALEEALQEIVRRHDILRTRFDAVNGQGAQIIENRSAFRCELIDLSAHGDQSSNEDVQRLIRNHANVRFDLRAGPLIRTTIVRLSDEEHLLLVNLHHIVADGWSVGVLLRELGHLYAGSTGSPQSPLSPLPVQYADYAIWQRDWLDGPVGERHLDHWRRRLAGATTALSLPTDRPRPAVQSFAGAASCFVVPQDLSRQLSGLARRESASLYMVFLAAFSALLGRYSDQRDILVGSPVNGRSRPELEDLIGMFVNMLVMRCDLSGDPAFRDYLAAIKETALDAYAHQDLPFEKLVEALQPERDLSRQPLFQVCLSFENIPFDELELAGVTISPVAADQHLTAKFDLTLFVREATDGIACTFEYATDLFEAATIARLADHFVRLLQEIAARPEARLSELSLLSAVERQQLTAWSGDSVAYPQDRCLHELFAEQAARDPGAPAAVMGDEELSYGALERRANRLAHHLRRLGVGPDVIVGLCVERSLDMVVGVLGILKAGGAYLPLDPRYPAERLAYMLEDARVPVLVTQSGLMQRLPATEAVVVQLDVDASAIAGHAETAPAVSCDADHLAYVIYTSGSTGRPKGVMTSHRGIMNLADAQLDQLPLTAGDRILQFASISFDAAVWDLVMSWRVGAALVLAEQHDLMPGEPLRELLQRQRVTAVLLPPAALAALPVAPLPDLKILIAGGEACTAELLRPWLAGRRVFNAYGPTESSVCTTVHHCGDARRPPIGRALPNTRTYVLDAHLEPVPVGVAGELYIGGVGLARGYLHRPGLTAERFVPSPFARGERLYRTGDLARWRADGVLDYLGRLDHQVKLRGFRIELGEIEAALLAQAGIAQAAVVLREDGGAKRLLAYVVAQPGSAIGLDNLRQQLQRTLPDYMVPAAIVVLASLPLTPNGKLDRNALPAPEWQGPAETMVAPRNATEATLAAIWRDVLKREQVGIHDNFFVLGGDSIQSIQVVARARQAGLSLTARQVFEQQTIAALAVVAGEAGTTIAEQGLVAGAVPLTPIQHWLFGQDLAVPDHFNQAVLLDCAALTPELVMSALDALLRQHDALRLRFVRGEQGWQQTHDATAAALQSAELFEAIDLSGLDAAVQAPALRRHAERLQPSLDLAQGPVLRAALVELGEGGQRLLLIAHHLVMDGVSWRILLEDLGTALSALQRGEPVRLPAKTSSFRHWAERLVAHAQSDAARNELSYWRNVPWQTAPRLPRDHEEGENTAGTLQLVKVALDAAETQALLQQVPEVYHTEINDVLLTALVQAFAGWTGAPRLLVGLEGHGREELFGDVDVSRTVGWFTSLFPVLLDVENASDPGGALKRVKEQLRAVPQRGVGYGMLRYLGGGDVPAPDVEVSFNYLGQLDGAAGGQAFGFAPEDVGREQHAANRRPHLIDVSAHVGKGGLELRWFYAGELFEAATIERVAQRHVAALRELVAHCRSSAGGLTPSDVPLAQLDQDTLDRIVGSVGGARHVADLYPLSPLQRGLLFHSLYEPDAAVYVISLACRLQGTLDREAFEQAWRLVVARHAVLRTAFVGHELDRPQQVVLREAALPFRHEDWRHLPAPEQDGRFAELQRSERSRGFDFAQPPLMRLCLVRIGDDDHRLLWNVHHIVLDGWSLPLLLDEVFAAYSALSRSAVPALSDVQPFKDYVGWLQRQDMAQAEAHWRRRLAGFDTPSSFGLARPTAAAHADQTERHVEQHGELALADLERFARQHRLTVNTLVQGAWALLLGRYGRSDDVVFGVTVSGRPAELAEVERTVGLFINTMPLRVGLPGQVQVLDWLAEIQARQSELTDYQYTSLADVQRWSEVAEGTALFESIVAFENYPVEMTAVSGQRELRISEVAPLERTNYPLTLQVTVGTTLSFRLIADTTRFAAAAARRLVAHLARLLGELILDPARPISAIPLLSGDERQQVVRDFNATAVNYPSALLHEQIAAQAKRTPEAMALRCEDQTLSYDALERRANRLAHHLQTLGVGPDVVVGICAERSLEMVTGLLGILKAGGAYLPLDPGLPPERLAMMLDDAKVTVVLAQDALIERLPASKAVVVRFAADATAIAGQPDTAPFTSCNPDNLAYVIYTSGSTGRPKGVMNSHRGIVNRLAWMQDAYRLTAGDVVLQKTPFGFDVSVWELFWPLTQGAELVIARPGGHQDPAYLSELIERHGVTVMHFVPSMLQAFLEAGELGRCGSLREVICSGEALPVETQNRFLAALPSRLHNLYGPTEAAVDVSFWPCRSEPEQTQVPIGRPISNIQLYVLDAHLEPVPVGVAGELYIGGVGLARGYLHRPGLTAERFVPSPFARGERLYRTGDLARWRADGVLDYLGRLDHQVKLRGFRIELGEIEAALLAQAGIAQAAVVLREDGGSKRLLAYVVAQPEAAIDPDTLRGRLQRSLPDYMVPAAIVVLASLPLTPNGKLDRNALPAPERQGPAETMVAPRNATEATLAAIWRDVLRREQISVTDNFFALGGDSIQSIQVVARARQAGLSLTARQVFEQQTIAALAVVAGEAGTTIAEQGLVAGAVPLTPIQHWLLGQDLAVPDHFNQAVLLDCAAQTPELLMSALDALLRQHDALRLRFVRGEQGWQQTHDATAAALQSAELFEAIDLSGLDAAVQAPALRRHAERLQPSLDLAQGPVLRAALVELGEGGQRLLLIAHHLVMDGVSWRILLEDLGTALSALQRGEPVRLPAKTSSFRHWAERLVAHAQSDAARNELSYWRNVPWQTAPRLPRDHEEGENTAGTLQLVKVALDAAETQALLQQVPEVYHTEINDVLLTALVQAFAGWTGAPRLLVGLEGHGREELFGDFDVSRTVGWFTSLFPVLLDVENASDPGGALKRVKEQLRAVPQRGVGYGMLRYLGGGDVPAPDVEVSFNYLGQLDGAAGGQAFGFAPEDVGREQHAANRRPHLIDVSAHVGSGGLQMQWAYSVACHDGSTIEALAESFAFRLRQLIAHCDTSEGSFALSDFPLLQNTLSI
ncbi:non-ribosomal peptide synthetase [Bradyrhizobium sp. SZCCHNS2021]|uniref:non-ribosomal peptide synthetase n=1 Tax=Bradyrhizobium sp. SZCCHNS2021 TaxID=3057307 RepID=UPI0028E5F86B|nr:non-ribosomal peptide synthetase [Bradyrhizobium sp. SZCCHNS2021]